MKFNNPYATFADAINDKFSKWPTNKLHSTGYHAAWADLCSGVQARLKRAEILAENQELLKAGREVMKRREAEKLHTQLGKKSA